MINKFVTAIGGIEGFGVISIILFFVVFISALVWVFCLKKSFLKNMSALPLDDGEASPATKGHSHE